MHWFCLTGLIAAPDVADEPWPVPPPPNADTCTKPKRDNTAHSEHFVVEWDGNLITEGQAGALGAAADEALATFVDDYGWELPPGADRYKLAIRIVDNGIPSGFTATSECDGTEIPYILVGSRSIAAGESFWQEMIAHEVHHTIQHAYGPGWRFWFWEATAVWSQDYVFDHDVWPATVSAYADNPHIAMQAVELGGGPVFEHMYGMAIFPRFLDEKVGGHDLVRSLWEDFGEQGNGDVDMFDVLDDFDTIYRDFVVANALMDYEDHDLLPQVVRTEASLPYEGGPSDETRPGELGQNFYRFDATDDSGKLRVTLDGDGPWIVLVAGETDGALVDVVEMKGGVADLPDAASYDHTWVIVSPGIGADDAVDYTLTAEVGTFPDDEEEPKGCGCNATPLGSAGFAMALLVGMAMRRFRR